MPLREHVEEIAGDAARTLEDLIGLTRRYLEDVAALVERETVGSRSRARDEVDCGWIERAPASRRRARLARSSQR